MREYLSGDRVKELELIANDLRETVIDMLIPAGSGHTAGPLDMADIFAVLFFHAARIDPKNPEWPERDRIILSNGHICPILYSAMAHRGFFPVEECLTLRKFGSRLQGHPHKEWLPGLETSSGPLGAGLGQGVGMALAERIDHGRQSNKFFYVLTGDGELNEGMNWEAIMLAGKEKIHNLIAIVDRNNIQIDGFTEDVMPLEPLPEKWAAFGWHVQQIDGHNIEQINNAIAYAKAVFDKPSVIIAHTIAGKGIEFAERRPEWHGNPPGKGPTDVVPKELQGETMLREIRTLRGMIEQE